MDCTQEETILAGYLEPEATSGLHLRTLWLLASETESTPTSYWILTVGTFDAGKFVESRSFPFPGGFPATPVRVTLDPEIRVIQGDLLAFRLTPTSPDAVPLRGLSIVPEYSTPSARAR